jgi:hypothetical protein
MFIPSFGNFFWEHRTQRCWKAGRKKDDKLKRRKESTKANEQLIT